MEYVKSNPAYGEEYIYDAIEGTPHDYAVYYLYDGECVRSKKFSDYNQAYNYGVDFAGKLVEDNDTPVEVKEKVLRSLHILDVTESRDVTPTEFKNTILRLVKDL